jgi:poly-gamma-glutamate synthesis protein (capsule biosynthesis protein)
LLCLPLLVPFLLGACGGSAGFSVDFATVTPSPLAAASSIADTPSTVTPSSSPVPPTQEPGIITIAAVGDLMLGRTIGDRLLAEGPAVPFEHVSGTLAAATVAVANLEGPIAATGTPASKGYTFLAPPEAIASLVFAGVDAVSLANNHSLDYGPEALAETIRLLDAAGIAHAGAGSNAAEARRPAVIEVNGLRVAFLAYVETPAEGDYSRSSWEATATTPGVAWLDPSYFGDDISAARQQAGFVVVLLHFGREFSPDPTAEQRAQARAAIDAGADLVLGAHPHLLQPVEEYSGGLIAYSLGNFVFDGFDGASNESAILLARLTARGVLDYELVPVDIVDNGIPRVVEE